MKNHRSVEALQCKDLEILAPLRPCIGEGLGDEGKSFSSGKNYRFQDRRGLIISCFLLKFCKIVVSITKSTNNMIRWLSLFSMVLSVLLMGCSLSTTAKLPSVAGSPNQATAPSGQQLPISAQAVVPNGTTIQLEVAQTPQQQEMGLMYRPALPDDRGMLFKFPSPQPTRFWMKNVPVALDMVFIKNGIVKYIQAAAPGCASEPCATYGPNVPIDTVIELRSGRSAELGLKVGDRVKIKFLNTGISR